MKRTKAPLNVRIARGIEKSWFGRWNKRLMRSRAGKTSERFGQWVGKNLPGSAWKKRQRKKGKR